jgi:plastocyanin
MELILLVLILAGLGAVALVAGRRSKERELSRREEEVAPVRKLAFEDITAFGEDLQELDLEMSGHELDAGANADYQRALDAYESAKLAGDSITQPDDIRHITEIIEDGRYAVACVRARVAGDSLPTRRPPCFFDPRHGPSVTEVPYVPPDGVERDVPACALDAERVRAGADPDVRKVMVGAQRVPYWQGGRAYEPYAMGYFGAFGPMTWMFMGGMMFGDFGGGYDGDGGEGGGDGGGDGGGAGPKTVTISNFEFSPDTLEVKVGDTITVDNKDQTEHTVTARDKSFDTGTFMGKTNFTVTKAGTFEYTCEIHPFMPPKTIRVVA